MIDHGHSTGFQCLRGTVTIVPSPGIGATNAKLFTQFGFAIDLRQVPGPSLTGMSLTSANNQFVRVCGNFTFDQGRPVMNVTSVQPILF